MRPTLPLVAMVVLQPQPCFVDECGRLERMVSTFSIQVAARDATELCVNHREELAARGGVPGRHPPDSTEVVRIPDGRSRRAADWRRRPSSSRGMPRSSFEPAGCHAALLRHARIPGTPPGTAWPSELRRAGRE